MDNTIKADVIAVIFVYNHADYLRKCLEGVAGQIVSFDFKAVIHDDHSTDESVSIIQEYAEMYPELIIPLIEKENQHSQEKPVFRKMTASFDTRYIALCEGDDYWCDPYKLQKQYDHMEENPECSMCTHNTRIHDLSGQTDDRVFYNTDRITSLTATEVFDSWPVHYSSYFIRNDYDIVPEWGENYWFGDYVILTIAYPKGRIDVLPDVMSVYNFNNSAGMTVGIYTEGESRRIEKTVARADYLRDYLKHTQVDAATEKLINKRVKAIDEAAATDRLVYDLSLCKPEENDGINRYGWLVDRLNDPLVRDECICPSQATENNGATFRTTLLYKYIQNYLNEFESTLNDDQEERRFLSLIVEVFGYKNRNPEIADQLLNSPCNKIGWNSVKKMDRNPVDTRILYLSLNYDYCYLKGRLEKAKSYTGHKGTLVVGSSYALVGFDDKVYPDSFNCSMHSQDFYYDYLCIKEVLGSVGRGKFSKCFIITGYYSGYTDLSLSNSERIERITRVYYPVFGDAHHWDSPYESNRWRFLDSEISDEEKSKCERIAIETSMELPYFSQIRKRGPYYVGEPNEVTWSELSDDERDEYANKRGGTGPKGHGSVIRYKDSFEENRRIYSELIDYLTEHNVRPVFIIPPHSKEYLFYVPQDIKDSILEIVNSTDKQVDYVDFNESDIFETEDFIDADHLSEIGSRKFMDLLYQLFGDEDD